MLILRETIQIFQFHRCVCTATGSLRALTKTCPYENFVAAQLAGDLLPAADEPTRRRNLIATGYIANSRRFGSRVDDYPQHLTIEDTLDNFGRAFLACRSTALAVMITSSIRFRWTIITVCMASSIVHVIHGPALSSSNGKRDLVALADADQVREFSENKQKKQQDSMRRCAAWKTC